MKQAGEKSDTNVTRTADAGAPERAPNLAVGEVGPELAGAELIGVPPSLYARFENFQLLGRGGMGVVYRAHDIRLDRHVAIKLLSHSPGSSGGGLLQEARSQARLRHENACEVYEAGIADHVPFIAMQLIDGAPLSRAKDEMTLEEKVRALRVIASALHEAHRLGLVHRDVKPGNILIERGEDGAFKPYILDFGLAREVAEGGPTLAATVQGTPAFMAPEQAEGKMRALDRRTDVYGLGATLYDVLAGRPPFEGDSVLDVLRRVMDEDPPPLRRLDPTIPRDLEAAVMKCLEKEPGARYTSARALGEDLQRFLDGDPVLARPVSWAAILFKRARRHKATVALAAALLATALIVAGLWLIDRYFAARRAELARELGERITEMELFLRAAHGMPLHDVDREREVVRGRLRSIEARMAEAGETGVGPGHDALGRGLLALGDPRAALDHFRQAEAAGHRSPGLDYATGVALIRLYKQALDSSKHIQNEAQRRARVAAIEAEYKAPALARLRAALGEPVVSAAYVEGLIALHEGRDEDARERAQAAFTEAPWMYEAKKLEGDALFALGSRHRADKAFDYDKAMEQFRRAADVYAAAADLGRSDPAVYAADCELWTQVMNAASEHGASMRPGFDRARAACERAITASPKSPEAYVMLAWVHNCFAWWVAANRDKGEDPDSALREAAVHAGNAAERSPDDSMAQYVVGAVWRTRALDALNRGRSAREALDRAVTGYEAALRLEPDFLWAMNELCSSLAMRGKDESLHDRDPRASFAAAAERCERAIVLDPDFMYPRANRVLVSMHEAEHLVWRGRSPEVPVAHGLAWIDALEKQNPAWLWIPVYRARLFRAAALHALASGGDAAAPLSQADAACARLAPEGSFSTAAETRGLVSLTRAHVQVARGEDPEAALRQARGALTRAVDAAPLDIEDRLWLAEVELLTFRWAELQRRPDAAALSAAQAALSPLLAATPGAAGSPPVDDPRLLVALAEIQAARARLQITNPRVAGGRAQGGGP